MARMFLWTESSIPSLIFGEDEAVISFYDYPDMWNFQIGDVIQYKTRIGVSTFIVEIVQPANEPNYSETLRKVTARKHS